MSNIHPDDPVIGAPSASFIGRGISWPLHVDHTGSIAMTEGHDDLAGSIRFVLSTAPGERLMRPRFGCRIWDLMFEPLNHNTRGLIAHAVHEALSEWEPRITVDDVVVTDQDRHLGVVRIDISYRIRSTNDRRNLVYPFYLIPHEEETP